ncbi:unnamed protein product [Vitrella brassicaformis CCMP3155]|uniref:Uncharacterized protein n=1 Tax=Vitrella brassicaformis (strain CCMP3155) TaxID=1169540 RepID=A0A0G4GIS9_VITBC|nr:unnamed protein product [Vitrella brassicaformis CCMP3155]|eukprot:CEM29745.1 unnamed protein product [Vitrella brassicaformis CCMP3155]
MRTAAKTSETSSSLCGRGQRTSLPRTSSDRRPGPKDSEPMSIDDIDPHRVLDSSECQQVAEALLSAVPSIRYMKQRGHKGNKAIYWYSGAFRMMPTAGDYRFVGQHVFPPSTFTVRGLRKALKKAFDAREDERQWVPKDGGKAGRLPAGRKRRWRASSREDDFGSSSDDTSEAADEGQASDEGHSAHHRRPRQSRRLSAGQLSEEGREERAMGVLDRAVEDAWLNGGVVVERPQRDRKEPDRLVNHAVPPPQPRRNRIINGARSSRDVAAPFAPFDPANVDPNEHLDESELRQVARHLLRTTRTPTKTPKDLGIKWRTANHHPHAALHPPSFTSPPRQTSRDPHTSSSGFTFTLHVRPSLRAPPQAACVGPVIPPLLPTLSGLLEALERVMKVRERVHDEMRIVPVLPRGRVTMATEGGGRSVRILVPERVDQDSGGGASASASASARAGARPSCLWLQQGAGVEILQGPHRGKAATVSRVRCRDGDTTSVCELDVHMVDPSYTIQHSSANPALAPLAPHEQGDTVLVCRPGLLYGRVARVDSMAAVATGSESLVVRLLDEDSEGDGHPFGYAMSVSEVVKCSAAVCCQGGRN